VLLAAAGNEEVELELKAAAELLWDEVVAAAKLDEGAADGVVG
jgi:hypothetical protein